MYLFKFWSFSCQYSFRIAIFSEMNAKNHQALPNLFGEHIPDLKGICSNTCAAWPPLPLRTEASPGFDRQPLRGADEIGLCTFV